MFETPMRFLHLQPRFIDFGSPNETPEPLILHVS